MEGFGFTFIVSVKASNLKFLGYQARKLRKTILIAKRKEEKKKAAVMEVVKPLTEKTKPKEIVKVETEKDEREIDEWLETMENDSFDEEMSDYLATETLVHFKMPKAVKQRASMIITPGSLSNSVVADREKTLDKLSNKVISLRLIG